MDSRLLGLDLKTSLSALTDLVMPRVCIVCGEGLMPQEKHICTCCLADMPLTRFETWSRNPMADRFNARVDQDGYGPYSYAAALYYYNEEAGYRFISQALKYHRNFSAGRHFGRMLGDRLSLSELFADVDTVVPVPLHFARKWKRGYNQAEVIAREVTASLREAGIGAELDTGLLKRVRRTISQTRLSGEEKEKNVEGAFSCRKGGRQCRHILLVDDVFTTGSTLAACHKALRQAFGSGVRISVATLGFVSD